jgi:hypothetical protein
VSPVSAKHARAQARTLAAALGRGVVRAPFIAAFPRSIGRTAADFGLCIAPSLAAVLRDVANERGSAGKCADKQEITRIVPYRSTCGI